MKKKEFWVRSLSADVPADAKPDRLYTLWHLLHSVRGREITSRANRKFVTESFYLTYDNFILKNPVESREDLPTEDVCWSCSNLFSVLDGTIEVKG